jgi:hypothetical protein
MEQILPKEIEDDDNDDLVKKFNILDERGTKHILVN